MTHATIILLPCTVLGMMKTTHYSSRLFLVQVYRLTTMPGQDRTVDQNACKSLTCKCANKSRRLMGFSLRAKELRKSGSTSAHVRVPQRVVLFHCKPKSFAGLVQLRHTCKCQRVDDCWGFHCKLKSFVRVAQLPPTCKCQRVVIGFTTASKRASCA